MNNWDLFKRMLCNIQKALYNSIVNQLMQLHYQLLHLQLVVTLEDESVFNDTYLKLTYKYNPDKDFIQLFIWIFKLLKGAYYRDSKASSYYLLLDDKIAVPDNY